MANQKNEKMKYLITGGCGFLGSNLAAEILKNGEELFVFDNLYRMGANKNLEWLQSIGDFKHYHSDIRNYNDVEYAIKECKPDVIFHLSGQVAMTTSIENPRFDFETNVLGGHNLLDNVLKHSPNSIIIYSSTNKVYGDMNNLQYQQTDKRYFVNEYPNGFDENLTLHFESPYGCSKGAIDQYMLDYAKIFGLKTVVFRHSSIFGGRQFATINQGWIGWFIDRALATKQNKIPEFTISGTGKQVRDVLFVDDLINCYFSAVKNIEITKGNVYNIGGGMENSLSLLELFDILESKINTSLNYIKLPERNSDQKVFVADCQKAFKHFNWKPLVSKDKSIDLMIEWVKKS